MAGQGNLIQIVHAGAPKGTIGDRKAGRLDDVRFDTQAGAKPENRAGILGDVRLVEGDPHGHRAGA